MAYNINSSTFSNNTKKKKNPVFLWIILIALAIGMIGIQYIVMDINSSLYEQMQKEQEAMEKESASNAATEASTSATN